MMNPILVVEDDENDIFFLTYAMEKVGLENPLQIASDGREAVDYFKGHGKFADRLQFPLPCLVMLDLKLPYLRGLDVLKWMRQEAQLTTIVIVFSSSENEADIEAAYRLGANAYLVKPTETSKLVEMAKAMKDFWLTHNRAPQLPKNSSVTSLHRAV